MKQYIFTALAVAAILTACNSDDMHEDDATSTATITFAMTGDFQLTAHDITRAWHSPHLFHCLAWVGCFAEHNGAFVDVYQCARHFLEGL